MLLSKLKPLQALRCWPPTARVSEATHSSRMNQLHGLLFQLAVGSPMASEADRAWVASRERAWAAHSWDLHREIHALSHSDAVAGEVSCHPSTPSARPCHLLLGEKDQVTKPICNIHIYKYIIYIYIHVQVSITHTHISLVKRRDPGPGHGCPQ